MTINAGSQPLRVVALCRMSVAYDDFGNQRQDKAIREDCVRRGAVVVAAKHDVMSATKFRLNDRPGYVDAQRMIADGLADAIAIYHIDRLTRDNRDLEDVIDSGVVVLCASGEIDLSTDMGRTVARILTAVAKGEVERKSARQKLELAQRLDRGLPFPGGPRLFGYSADGMEINEDEAEALRWAVGAALDGRSLRQIVRGLSTAGFHSSRAKHGNGDWGWTHAGVRKMLLNPRYVGWRVVNGEQHPGLWPTLLDPETRAALTRLFGAATRDPLRGRARNSRKPSHLLSKIARCAVCNDLLIAGRGGDHPTYRCRSPRACAQPPQAALERAVEIETVALLSSRDFAASLLPANDDRAERARIEQDRVSRRLTVLQDDFNAGEFETEEEIAEYRRSRREMQLTVRAYQSVLDDLADIAMFEDLTIGTELVASEWRELSLERRRKIVARLMEIKVSPAVGRSWDAERCATIRRRPPITLS